MAGLTRQISGAAEKALAAVELFSTVAASAVGAKLVADAVGVNLKQ
jgi:hypothetical protein